MTKNVFEESKQVWDFLHNEPVKAIEPRPRPKSKPKRASKVSESLAQQRVFRWAGTKKELALMYHIPNEGAGGNYGRMQKLVAEGLRAGVPDIHLPISRGGYHGLWIELKVGYNKPTEQQLEWIAALNNEGHFACWCRGEQEAISIIEKYLEGKLVRDD